MSERVGGRGSVVAELTDIDVGTPKSIGTGSSLFSCDAARSRVWLEFVRLYTTVQSKKRTHRKRARQKRCRAGEYV